MKAIGYICVILINFLFGCFPAFFCKDDNLMLSQKNYSGEQLNLQGYFFGEANFIDNPAFAKAYIFFKNGVTHNSTEHFNELSAGIGNYEIYPIMRQTKDDWGLFIIQGNSIEIERWQPGLCGVKTIYERGIIENDSTFILQIREFRVEGKVERKDNLESIYRFRPLTQKPDSTNSFLQ